MYNYHENKNEKKKLQYIISHHCCVDTMKKKKKITTAAVRQRGAADTLSRSVHATHVLSYVLGITSNKAPADDF